LFYFYLSEKTLGLIAETDILNEKGLQVGTLDTKWPIPTVLFGITAIAMVCKYVFKLYLDDSQRTKKEQRQALRTICRALKELLRKVSQYNSLEVFIEVGSRRCLGHRQGNVALNPIYAPLPTISRVIAIRD